LNSNQETPPKMDLQGIHVSFMLACCNYTFEQRVENRERERERVAND